MAIRPEEAAKFNDEDDIKLLAAAEKTLDDILKKQYHTGTSVTINSKSMPLNGNHRLLTILLNKYREVGWEVKSNYDQRDNDSWYTFSSKIPHRSPVSGSLRGMDNSYIRDDGNSIGLYAPGTR